MDARAELSCRDPAAQQFHLAAAALALCLAPLGIVVGEVAFWLLMTVALVRARALWPVWIEALGSPLAIAIYLFVAWMIMSLTWSTDANNGLSSVRCLRALLWGPLLYPLLGDTRSRVQLLYALLTGTTILAGSQIVQWITFMWIHGGKDLIVPRFGGLHGEVGKAGLWSGAGLCIGALVSLDARLSARVRLAAVAAAAICMTGLIACSTLRALIGATAGLVAVALLHIGRPRAGGAHASLLPLCLFVAISLGGLIAVIGYREVRDRRIGEQLSPAAADASAPSPPVVTAHTPGEDTLQRILTMPSIAPRLFWWGACWKGFLARPAFGWGWGSTPTILKADSRAAEFAQRNPRVAELHPGMFEAAQPHSLYVMTIAELGTVGGVLLAAIVVILVRGAARAARWSVALGGPAAATVLWLAAVAGDTAFNTSVLAAGTIVVAFTTRISRRESWQPS